MHVTSEYIRLLRPVPTSNLLLSYTKMINKTMKMKQLTCKINLFPLSSRRFSTTLNCNQRSVDPKQIEHFNKQANIWWDKGEKFKGLRSLNYLRYNSCEAFSTTTNNEQNKSNIQNSSVDPSELEQFNKLDNIWWDKEGKLQALHKLNDIRIPFTQQTLEEKGVLNADFINTSTPLKDLNILDSGCGGGILSEALALLGANITGLDIGPNLIKCAKEHANKNPDLKDKITYICSPLENIAHQYKDKFDVVISSEIIEHVGSKEVYLKSLVDVLKPQGSLILSTLNQTWKAWYIYVAYGEYISRKLPRGCHHWKKLVRPETVKKILAENNCKIIKMRGFTSCPGYTTDFDNWYWCDNLDTHYILHAIKN